MISNKSVMWKLRNAIIREALADEGQSTEGTTEPVVETKPTEPTVNFEDLILKARKEEKDKLYPQITKLKEENQAKTARINELLIAVAEANESVKAKDTELNKVKATVENNTAVNDEVVKLQNKIIELETELANKEGEVKTIKLETFKKEKIAEAQGQLIPELVVGNTEEEIANSIEVAKARYAEIVGQVQNTVVVTSKPTQPPVVNPNTAKFQEGMAQAELSQMSLFDPGARAKYSELRKQLGIK